MAKSALLIALKVLMILIFAGWVTVWILKPTQLWTRKWKVAEDNAGTTVFGYYGLNFAVYTFPVIAVTIIGLVYLSLKPRGPRTRQVRSSVAALSNPIFINSTLGILSAIEILGIFLFVIFLGWSFYARISSDFNKRMPENPLKLNAWQYKYYRVAIRFGLLAEACLALLLLSILRGLAVFRVFGIQFEASVRYHTWLGTAMIFFATFHGLSNLFIWGITHHIQDKIWMWQKTGRIYLAGEITLVIGLIIWITSLPQIRRKWFEIFYYTHHLYMVFFVFYLFHAGDRHFYMVFSGVFLFAIDKLLRIIQSRPATCILSARIFPCKVIELTLPKDPRLNYAPTSVIFMKIPSISKLQWHSFSITSSSILDHQTLSFMIKCEGWWTSALYNMIQAELDMDSDQMKCIPVAIEGPYGPASLDFMRYHSLLLVAGGIGITPFLSILQEIFAKVQSSNSRHRYPKRMQLIFIVKKSQDICLLNSISHLLQNQPAKEWHLKLRIFVTQEDHSGATVRDVLNEYSEEQRIYLDTKCSKYAIHGTESLLWMAALTGLSSILFLVFLSCFNHVFIPTQKKASKQKTPSSVSDLLIICSFIIAIVCSTLVAIVLRWRKLRKKEIPPVSQKQGKSKEPSSINTRGGLYEHEIHFGGRPNFQDILSDYATGTEESRTGVLVCGPESMKESVASSCQKYSQGFRLVAEKTKKKPYFDFHSLNFTL